jgi:hypothetical protein
MESAWLFLQLNTLPWEQIPRQLISRVKELLSGWQSDCTPRVFKTCTTETAACILIKPSLYTECNKMTFKVILSPIVRDRMKTTNQMSHFCLCLQILLIKHSVFISPVNLGMDHFNENSVVNITTSTVVKVIEDSVTFRNLHSPTHGSAGY